jgi:hypothetical protein
MSDLRFKRLKNAGFMGLRFFLCLIVNCEGGGSQVGCVMV